MTLSPGQAFGNYRILSRIGVGGMGMVFLAEHPHIGKRVALKIIHRDLAGNREVVNRFLNEARAVNQIGSEHIVQIHDFGQTEDGEHFFIMEHLDGRTLAQDMASGPLAVPRSLHIGAQIAAALAAAHDSSIIHRDLKPDNVMLIDRLGDRDFVKLLDFGLAKFLSDADARKLTAAGVVLGTPHYMSPEACESKPNVDHRCDVYSLGVLLFQMVTGQLPFSGESMGEVLVKQVVQPPPAPRGINPQVPPAVEQVVLRCLAKDPGSRFQNMRDLRDALLDPTGYLSSSPPVVPVSASPAARTLYAGAAERAGAATVMAGMTPPGGAADRPTEMALGATMRPEWDAPSGAPTTYMDDSAHRRYAAPPSPPARPAPRPVENRTMAIATPAGYSDRPPRPLWPLVAVILIGGAAAGVVAYLLIPKPDPPPPRPLRPAAGAVADAGPRMARIRLTTRPSGAEVSDGTGNRIGITPTEISLPLDGREVVLRFQHPEAADSEKRFTPTADTAFDLELPPAPAPEPAEADAGVEEEPPTAREAPRQPEKKRRPRRRKKIPSDLLVPEL
ncbi:MAG TPA: serine/threonine-protein kinase [Kofleriaceae bacterium]|nr:serine/threonine-protein kinase [Kofleriaceae bacterium]